MSLGNYDYNLNKNLDHEKSRARFMMRADAQLKKWFKNLQSECKDYEVAI